MIKIDGEKIKALREQQGLTQLYMATAVGVTTDTISRWENKRYPTIKEENAEKLAEALEVEVAEILLVEENEVVTTPAEHVISENSQSPQRRKPTLPLIIITTAIFATIGIFVARALFNKGNGFELNAVRIMPERALPNNTFPVIIKVHYTGDEPLSIILKENLPKGSVVLETSPPNGSTQEGREIKWLKKVGETTRFSYLIKISGDTEERFTFDGTISTATTDDSIQVNGVGTIQLGPYHWADTDGDNTISDQEILTVFDYYSEIDDFTVDIEFIEKMWLGSKYTWDEKEQKISISP